MCNGGCWGRVLVTRCAKHRTSTATVLVGGPLSRAVQYCEENRNIEAVALVSAAGRPGDFRAFPMNTHTDFQENPSTFMMHGVKVSCYPRTVEDVRDALVVTWSNPEYAYPTLLRYARKWVYFDGPPGQSGNMLKPGNKDFVYTLRR